MTGKTHDQIALASALGTGLALSLPIDQAAVMAMGAYAVARAPDYTEPLARWIKRRLRGRHATLEHRTVTHYLPTGVALALTFLGGLTAAGLAFTYAAAWSAGVLEGWWAHSLADALTDRGCWLWRRRRQVLLPDRLRIRVYTIEKRKHWLTRQVTTSKRPSNGERAYLFAATLAVWALAAVQVVMVAHTSLNPHA